MAMTIAEFQQDIRTGIPDTLPELQPYDTHVNHAPKRKDILTSEEKQLALRNALRYFPQKMHEALAPEFAQELADHYVVMERGAIKAQGLGADMEAQRVRQMVAI